MFVPRKAIDRNVSRASNVARLELVARPDVEDLGVRAQREQLTGRDLVIHD